MTMTSMTLKESLELKKKMRASLGGTLTYRDTVGRDKKSHNNE